MSTPQNTATSATAVKRLLMEMATPELYHRLPFRLLELPTDATVRDITKRRQVMEMAARNQLAAPPGPAQWLPPASPPDDHDVREAGHALQDALRRIVHEFFWFWPLRPGERDEALQALHAGDAGLAVQHWESVAEGDAGALAAAQHNLAVMSFYGALETDHKIISTPEHRTKDRLARGLEHWSNAWGWWNHVLEGNHGLWDRVGDRIRAINDPALPPDAVLGLRQHLPAALAVVHLRSVLRLQGAGMDAQARQSMQCLALDGSLQPALEEARRTVLDPLRKTISDACDQAEKQAAQDKEKGTEILDALLERTSRPLEQISGLVPDKHPLRESARDQVALAALTCQITYGNKTEDWKTSEKYLERILAIASGDTAKQRISKNLEIVRKNREGSALLTQCWFCGESDAKEACQVEYKMHGDIKKEWAGFNQYRLTWKQGTIKVPRCQHCKDVHKGSETAAGVGGCGFLLGILIAIIVGYNSTPEKGFLTFAVLAVVCLIMAVSVKMLSPKARGLKRSHREFPLIKELLSDGWSFGEKPSTN